MYSAHRDLTRRTVYAQRATSQLKCGRCFTYRLAHTLAETEPGNKAQRYGKSHRIRPGLFVAHGK
jgi:ribosomal protein L32